MNAGLFKISAIGVIFFLLIFVDAAHAGKSVARAASHIKKQSITVRLQLEQRIQGEPQIEKELQTCKEILKVSPDNHEILLKSAYLHFRLGWLYSEGDAKKNNYFKLLEFATRAKLIKPHDYYSLLLVAVAKAKTVDYLPQGDQVRIARELAQEVQLLMDRNNDDMDVMYLLSWLNFEVGKVSKLKKVLASVFFGGLPENLSVDNAFCLLKKLIKIRPDYIVYRYDLGLYNLNTGKIVKARTHFEKALSMLPQSVEGAIYQGRARKKIKKYCQGS